ncbi:TRAP transporter large permease [Mesorhizobium sp. M0817]
MALPQRMLQGVDQFVLLTIPLFLLAGNLMNSGGLSGRMIGFANALVGHFRGGLSLVTVLASTLFAGISGSAVAQASAIGSFMIPAMARQGIPAAYGAALVAISSVIDPLIPPSITMIVFGVLSGASIGQMFIAGVIPGLILGLSLLGYAWWKAARNNYPRMPKVPWSKRGTALISAIPALMLPVIIVGGVKTGIFTVTESCRSGRLRAAGRPAASRTVAGQDLAGADLDGDRHVGPAVHPRHGEHRRLRTDHRTGAHKIRRNAARRERQQVRDPADDQHHAPGSRQVPGADLGDDCHHADPAQGVSGDRHGPGPVRRDGHPQRRHRHGHAARRCMPLRGLRDLRTVAGRGQQGGRADVFHLHRLACPHRAGAGRNALAPQFHDAGALD